METSGGERTPSVHDDEESEQKVNRMIMYTRGRARFVGLLAVLAMGLAACSTGQRDGAAAEQPAGGSADDPVDAESVDITGTLADIGETDAGIVDPGRASYFGALKGKKVAFVPTSMGYDLTEGWMAFLRQELEPHGVEIVVRDPNWNTDAGAQAITQLIDEKPDVLLVQNPDIQSYAQLLERAQQAGIYVLQVNMKSNTTTDAFVGADWNGIGVLMAEQIVEQCGEGGQNPDSSGKVSIVQGPITAAASAYQLRGAMSVLDQHPEIEVVSDQPADWDASRARSITETVLQQHDDLCGVIGMWDGHDIGTAEAIAAAGRQDDVFLVTNGGAWQNAGCDNIENGNFDAYVSYDVPAQAERMATVIKMLWQQRPPVGSWRVQVYAPHEVLTADTLEPNSCWTVDGLGN